LLSQFDKSDAIAAMVGERLLEGDLPVIRFPVADESDAKSWDDAGLPLKDVIMINRLLIQGSSSAKLVSPSVVNEMFPFVERFWTVVQSISGLGGERQRAKTVAGQPVVLKALAKLAHDLAYGVSKLRNEEGLRTLYDAILSKKLSFDHKEPLWQALFMDDEQREKGFPGINAFVYLGDQFKGGEFDAANGWVRFGPAHNDIVPRLGDAIRWKLGLSNRGAAEKARAKIDAPTSLV
jgi:hypothetical protein